MEREKKAVSISALILLMYGLEGILNDRAFILPLPMNEILFTIVAFAFIFWNRKDKVGLIVAPFAICFLLSNPFVWTFFYSPEKMQQLADGPTLDIFKLSSALLMLFAGIMTGLRQKSIIGYIGLGIFFWSLIIAHLIDLPLLEVGGLIAMTISSLSKPVFSPFHLLWLLLTIFKGTTHLTLFFFNQL